MRGLDSFERTPLQRDQTTLLIAMNRLGKHVYGGTVREEDIIKRRRRNKAARAARKATRRAR